MWYRFLSRRQACLLPLILLLTLFTGARDHAISSPSPENYWITAFRQAQARKVFRVAYLGASVTCGQTASDVWKRSYAALLNTWLEEQTGVEINYTNYCVGSAMSLTGLVQLKREVLGDKPDLILAEFGILDGALAQPAAPANEAMIRLTHTEGIPFLMVAVATSETEATSRAHVVALGRHYDLPVADMQALMDERGLQWSDISIEGDRWHPNDKGHALLAESAILALEEVLTVGRILPTVLPAPYTALSYASARLIAAGQISYPEDTFETFASDAFKKTGQALRLKEMQQDGTLHFTFEGSVLGILFTHDAVPEAFTYRIDDNPVKHVTPMLWQKDHLLSFDLAPGTHEVILTFERGQWPVAIEGILVVPGV